jgi:hypothetical protein
MPAENMPAPGAATDGGSKPMRLGVTARGTPWERPLTMPADQLDHHLLIAGPPGAQRSRLLLTAALQAAGTADAAGERYPMLVLDTARQSVELVASLIWNQCPRRRSDLVLVDLVTPYEVAQLNLLDVRSTAEIPSAVKAAADILLAVSDARPDPDCLGDVDLALRAICEANLSLAGTDSRGNVLHLGAFLSRREFRAAVARRCSDRELREYFDPEDGAFEQMSSQARVRLLSFALSASAALEPLPFPLCHAFRSRVDLQSLFAGHKIVLVRLTRAYASTPCLLAALGAKLAEDAARSRSRIVIAEALRLFGEPGRASEFLSAAERHGAGVIAALDGRTGNRTDARRAAMVQEWVGGCRSGIALPRTQPGRSPEASATCYANLAIGHGRTGIVLSHTDELPTPTWAESAAAARHLRRSGYPFRLPHADNKQLAAQLTQALTATGP